MNKYKMNIVALFLGVFALIAFIGCDKGGQPEPGKTTTGDYAGDWFINGKDETGATLFEHAIHQTYNTAANDNTMWINDNKKGYEIKCKVTINIESGTFSSTNQPNLNDVNAAGVSQSTVTVTDGRIIKGGGVSKGGHTVDKISFKANFSYDPATKIISFEGTKRTGFAEDEYL